MADEKNQTDNSCLNSRQLASLEASFRTWADKGRPDIRLARRRILLIFLLIRYGGIKLSEVLALDINRSLDSNNHTLRVAGGEEKIRRSIALPEHISQKIRHLLTDVPFRNYLAQSGLQVDPAFVRRKFYERSEECGFAKQLASPEMIRRARAVELMQANVPLPAVQKFLGQATAGLTSAYAPFDEATLNSMTSWYVEQEGKQLSSARNTLYGRITAIQQGSIQALVEVTTTAHHILRSVITISSLKRLQLRVGRLVSAEIKAPWLHLGRNTDNPAGSADNCFEGEIIRITSGSVIVEYIVRSPDGMEFCALLSRPVADALQFVCGDQAWVFFSCFAVVLHAEPIPMPHSPQ